MTLLHVENLVLHASTPRGPAQILRGVDLRVGRGRIMGIVGESGSGKSSLAACLLRLPPPNTTLLTGRIVLDDKELLALPEDTMRGLRGTQLAMVFQDPMGALNPLFTIGTQMVDVLRRRHPGTPRRAALAQAEAMLARVAIADPRARLASYPHELSGGMRQRVMIAMALLAQPLLLLADEPTTALDATVEAQIVALLAGLRHEVQGSTLFITHHLALVAQLCDDIAVMYAGLVVETGPAAAILAAPRHPYTRALVACEIGDDAAGRLASIPGEVPDPVLPLAGCAFAPRCAHARPPCFETQPAMRETPTGFAACLRLDEIG
jgi:oligopeptide/dipeptide ABC transporter ATP-binding protein